MKKIILALLLILLITSLPRPVKALGDDGLWVVFDSTDGKNWTMTLWNYSGGRIPAGSSVTMEFGMFWCNLRDSANCDDNSLDFRGKKVLQNITWTVPASGGSTTKTEFFDIPQSCGTVQADVNQAGTIFGSIHNYSSNCPMSANLIQKPGACALVADWDVGFNDTSTCQIKIEAAGTLYTLEDKRCVGKWDSSSNPIPNGLPTPGNGAIYRLHAGVKSQDGTTTLSCTTPTPTVPIGSTISVTCSGTLNADKTVTWDANVSGTSGNVVPPFAYTWNSSDAELNNKNGGTVTVSYNSSGTKKATVTVKDSSNPPINSSPSQECSVTVPAAAAPGTMSPVPIASCVPGSTTDQKISVTWSPISAGSYQPILKSPGCTGSSIGGLTCIQTTGPGNYTFPASQPISGNYCVTVNAYGSSDCSTDYIKSEEKSVTNASCTPSPTPVAAAGCSLLVGGSNSGTVRSTVGNTLSIQSSNPNPPYRINIDGPSSFDFGPYGGSSGNATWYTSESGDYTVSNGCTSRDVSLNFSCATSGLFTLKVQTFLDPKFDPNQWPQYAWQQSDNPPGACWLRDDSGESGDSEGVSTSRPPEPTPSLKDQILEFLHNFHLTLSIPEAKAFGPAYATPPVPINQRCNSTADCKQDNTQNSCTFNQCVYWPGGGYSICQPGGKKGEGQSCGTNRVCHNYDPASVWSIPRCELHLPCDTNADCNGANSPYSGNSCVVGSCRGTEQTVCTAYNRDDECISSSVVHGQGVCSFYNQPPTTVCQKDAAGNPQKLCSPGLYPSDYRNFDPATGGIQASTCSVDYTACNSVGNTDYQNCCGTKNIQGTACMGYCQQARFPTSWNKDSATPFNQSLDSPTLPLAGITIVVEDTRGCGIPQTLVTGADGFATFYLPRVYKDRQVKYTVKAIPPAGSRLVFTRGVKSSERGNWDQNPGYAAEAIIPSPFGNSPPVLDNLSSGGPDKRVTFGFLNPVPPPDPWLQTTSGDVHSNARINTPGGP